jgi:hypothetical protein
MQRLAGRIFFRNSSGVLTVYRLPIMLLFCLLLSPRDHNVVATARPLAPISEFQEPLPVPDVLSFLEKCLERYDQQKIQGYKAVLHKQERIGERLQPSEEIEIYNRAKPHSVFMRWLKGERRAAAVLYVEGQNNGMMWVHPSGLAGKLVKVVSLDPEGSDARNAGRYSVKEVGLRESLAQTLKDWKAAKDKGILRVKYLGIRKVVEAGNRECYTLQRKSEPGEDDGILEVTVYIDKETWQPVRTVLKGHDNSLLGDYRFSDIRINAPLKSNQFEPSALSQ